MRKKMMLTILSYNDTMIWSYHHTMIRWKVNEDDMMIHYTMIQGYNDRYHDTMIQGYDENLMKMRSSFPMARCDSAPICSRGENRKLPRELFAFANWELWKLLRIVENRKLGRIKKRKRWSRSISSHRRFTLNLRETCAWEISRMILLFLIWFW